MSPVVVVGAGLAGAEAAFQLSRRGIEVRLFEMRPKKRTPVHRTDLFAELVCSNSLRSDALTSAHGLLKEEMRRLGSLVVESALESRVPAGQALAVDREAFSRRITERVREAPGVAVIEAEVAEVPDEGIVILATGPLTSQSLSESIRAFTGSDYLYFYDAVSPVVEVDSIDFEKAFRASRYGKGGDDYVNCPLSSEEYLRFYQALREAATVDRNEIDNALYFEGCLPIEVMAARGTLVLVGDPQRSYFPKDRFIAAAEYQVPVTRELEDAEIKATAVWRFRAG